MTIPTVVVEDDIRATPDDIALFRELEDFAARISRGAATAMPIGGPVIQPRWAIGDRYLQLTQKGTGSFDDDSARIALMSSDHAPVVEVRIEGLVTLQRSSTDAQMRARALLIATIANGVVDAAARDLRLTLEDAHAAGRAACHLAKDHFDAETHGALSYSRHSDGSILGVVVPGTAWRPMRLSVGGRQMPMDLRPVMPHMVGGSLTGRPRDVRSPALAIHPWDMAVDLTRSDAVGRMRDAGVLARVSAMATDAR